MATATIPLPLPLAGSTASQLSLAAAAHVHPAPAVTALEALAVSKLTSRIEGLRAYEHATPFCTTRVARLFTVTVTVRASRLSFRATTRTSGSSPCPEPGATSAHETSVLTVHGQLDGVATVNA